MSGHGTANVARETIGLAGPLDAAASLEVLRRPGDDLLDRWDGTWLVRAPRLGGHALPYAARPVGTIEEPALEVTVADPADLPDAIASARAAFPGDPAALAALAAVDPAIALLAARYPGLRTLRQPDLFNALVRAISAQQVNLRWAATLRRRLAEMAGQRRVVDGHEVWSLDPAVVAGLRVADVRALQFTTRKAEYIVGVATAIAEGRLDLDVLAVLPDDEVIRRLTAIRGLGVWTAEWILARTLGRPRVVAGDLGVRKAVGLAYPRLEDPLPPEGAVRVATAHWGDAALLAQALVLQELAVMAPTLVAPA